MTNSAKAIAILSWLHSADEVRVELGYRGVFLASTGTPDYGDPDSECTRLLWTEDETGSLREAIFSVASLSEAEITNDGLCIASTDGRPVTIRPYKLTPLEAPDLETAPTPPAP